MPPPKLWRLVLSRAFRRDVEAWVHEGGTGLATVRVLVESLETDPYTGPGEPEHLSRELKGWMSRRIDARHRLLYAVHDDEVMLIRCRDHYQELVPRVEREIDRWSARHRVRTERRRRVARRLRGLRRAAPGGHPVVRRKDETGYRVGWHSGVPPPGWAGSATDLHEACVVLGYAGEHRTRAESLTLEMDLERERARQRTRGYGGG